MRKPFYADNVVTLYHGDAREIAAEVDVSPRSVLITDPVWPNPGNVQLAGTADPAGLFADVVGMLVARGLTRAIVILGCDSDPRFLAAVPLPFRRVTWLRRPVPSYKGPILNGADVAYVFGAFGMAHKGQRVWPGEIVSTKRQSETSHPCPRWYGHLDGLIRGYTREDDHVIDLFAGSGTTVEAGARNRRRVTACEIDATYCLEIAARATEATAQMSLPVGGCQLA